MPKTSRPTLSASLISSSRCCTRSTGLIVRPVAGSEMAAAKLSTPICIFATPVCRLPLDDHLAFWSHVHSEAFLVLETCREGNLDQSFRDNLSWELDGGGK